MPSAMTSKWRWQPVDMPVLPMRPMPWRAVTVSPWLTETEERWLYVVTTL